MQDKVRFTGNENFRLKIKSLNNVVLDNLKNRNIFQVQYF